jgi:benzoate 4-monooxygenase
MRIGPNHISIADPDALHIVYAHGNGLAKSDFYDAFVSIKRGVFTTIDRAEHARKRKLISHLFSPKSILELDPHVRLHVEAFINQWDRLCAMASKGLSGTDGEGGWTGVNGQLWLDCLPCTCFPHPITYPYIHIP